MNISSAGYVGINTSTSALNQYLTINGSGGALANASAIAFWDSNSGGSRRWAIANGSSARGVDQIGVLTINVGSALSADPLTSGTEVMRFTTGGNVCVGSTSAGNAGTINVSIGDPGTTVGGLQLWSTTSATHYVHFGDGVSGADPYRGYVGYAHASDALVFGVASTEIMRIISGAYVGIGVTPLNTIYQTIQFPGDVIIGCNLYNASLSKNLYYNAGWKFYAASSAAALFETAAGEFNWYSTGTSTGTAGGPASPSIFMQLTNTGNLLVGTTTAGAGLGYATRIAVDGGDSEASVFKTSAGISAHCSRMWNSATSGDNCFIAFQTEAGGTQRGSITYNRTAGLTAYNTTSDYRAKDISGSVTDSGVLIDSTPVYMGKMKGATQERPMFIAHETPAYAHTGEKDAVDKDGNPVYQQMDASALIPVMWAEIQSLRKRLADAGI
jgi:hypothetical protein